MNVMRALSPPTSALVAALLAARSGPAEDAADGKANEMHRQVDKQY